MKGQKQTQIQTQLTKTRATAPTTGGVESEARSFVYFAYATLTSFASHCLLLSFNLFNCSLSPNLHYRTRIRRSSPPTLGPQASHAPRPQRFMALAIASIIKIRNAFRMARKQTYAPRVLVPVGNKLIDCRTNSLTDSSYQIIYRSHWWHSHAIDEDILHAVPLSWI